MVPHMQTRPAGQIRRFVALGFWALVAALDPAQVAAQQIQLEIRSPSANDDYLTWAPAPARIRQTPIPQGTDRRVVLTNDPERPVPPGRKLPLDGNLAFDKSVPSGATASQETLELVLPKDGSWVAFVVAGSFPRASTEDKDAIIEVHDGTATGPIIHTHAAMVRIRKDHRDLTDNERIRFLKAVSNLHRTVKGYERFVRVHELASMGKYENPAVYWWPDAAHRAAAFLAWHRAYLLSFERELQKIDASVALPYWRMDTLVSVFEENFMGSNPVSNAAFVEPTFAAGNPLANWVVNGTALHRFPYERRDEQTLKADFFSDEKLFKPATYFAFSRQLEGNPHGVGHNWTGPWMRNCMISPSDPVFWPFHTGFDRQWAKWQWLGGRLVPDGSKESYQPNDAYDGNATGCNMTSSSCVPVGHHLKDPMWPWNGKVGPGSTVKANMPPANLAQGFVGPFPKAAIDGLWPAAAAMPTPADVIDYAGATPQRLDMGFAYDDVPFGAKPTLLVDSGPQSPAGAPTPPATAVLAVVNDRSQPEARRIEGLRGLGEASGDAAVQAAVGVLAEANRSAALGSAAIDALAIQMMQGELDHGAHHAIMRALHTALSDRHVEVRQAALRTLAAHRDPALIEKLVAALSNPGDRTFSSVDAIRSLMVAGATQRYAPAIRAFLANADGDIRAAAATALASDPESRATIASMLADPRQPENVRAAALHSLAASGTDVTPQLLDIARRQTESAILRRQAAAALATVIETLGPALNSSRLDGIATDLNTLTTDAVLAPTLDRALKATDTLRSKK